MGGGGACHPCELYFHPSLPSSPEFQHCRPPTHAGALVQLKAGDHGSYPLLRLQRQQGQRLVVAHRWQFQREEFLVVADTAGAGMVRKAMQFCYL